VTLTPRPDEYGNYKIGVYMDFRYAMFANAPEGSKKANILDSAGVSLKNIAYYIKMTVMFIVRLFTRQTGVSDLAGPIGVGSLVNEAFQVTIAESVLSTVVTMLYLCALLSANLGVFNLLPLPALDGGKLAFLAYEGIRRKPVPREREGMVHFVGLVLLMILAVFIAVQDVIKIL
jgi:regulator of sigma E protease